MGMKLPRDVDRAKIPPGRGVNVAAMLANSVPARTGEAVEVADYSLSARFSAPVRVESEMNRREHWTARKRRFDAQAAAVAVAVKPAEGFLSAVANWINSRRGVVRVTLTRIGKRKCDSDNLAGGFKAVRDEIARLIGVDDGSDAFVWEYAQRTGGEYGVEIEIATEVV
jgi:hypothetical protein